MSGKNRFSRPIDIRLPRSGGGEGLAVAGGAGATPALPTPPAPYGLVVEGSPIIIYTAVSPQAAVNLRWAQPQNAQIPDSYEVRWATTGGYTNPTYRVGGGGSRTMGVDGLPVSTPAGAVTVWFSVRAVVQGVPSAWSSNVSAVMPGDTTAPAPPTDLLTSWSPATGDLTISWTNPLSPNLKDVRVRIFASSGGALLRDTASVAGRFVWTRAMQFADTGGAYDPSVHIALTSRSHGGVASATNLTGNVTLAAPSTPTGLAASFSGTGAIITWTPSAAVVGYTLTIDGVARPVPAGRYVYGYSLNAAEHGGTADPSLSLSLVAVDALGQTSPAAAGTATNAAPAAPASVTIAGYINQVAVVVTAPKPADFQTFRYRLIQTLPSAADVTFDDPRDSIFRGVTASATYRVGVRVVDAFGQASSETLSSTATADGLTLADLRAEVTYTDSIGTSPTTLKARMADDGAALSIGYTNAAWNWIEQVRPRLYRHRTTTLATTLGTQFYISTAGEDGVQTFWAGPVDGSGRLVQKASEAAAQSAPVTVATSNALTRYDLASVVNDVQRVRVYHKHPSTSPYNIGECFPRSLIQSDDIEAESIRAINIAAGTITADRMNVAQLSAIAADIGNITAGTMTGATIRTAASGARLELTTASGLRLLDASSVAQMSLAASTGLTLNTDIGYAAQRAIRWIDAVNSQETQLYRDTANYIVDHRVTSALPGRASIRATNTTDSGVTELYIARDVAGSPYGSSVGIVGAGLRVGTLGGAVSEGNIRASGNIVTTDYIATGSFLSAAEASYITATDAGTNTRIPVLYIQRRTTGTPSSGLGGEIRFQIESSTTNDRDAAAVVASWNTSTDASRAGQLTLVAYDASTAREGFRVRSNGSNAQIGFYGTTPVSRPTVSGSRGGNAALASALTALANLGLITDSST